MALQCPNCGSTDTQAGLSNNQCTNCGRLFDQNGLVDNGLDAVGRAEVERRLAPRQPDVVGNFADLQRLGAESIAPGTTKVDDAIATPPGLSDDEAKRGAKHALEENEAARDGTLGVPPAVEAGPPQGDPIPPVEAGTYANVVGGSANPQSEGNADNAETAAAEVDASSSRKGDSK